jgi:hypothetical protein
MSEVPEILVQPEAECHDLVPILFNLIFFVTDDTAEIS